MLLKFSGLLNQTRHGANWLCRRRRRTGAETDCHVTAAIVTRRTTMCRVNA